MVSLRPFRWLWLLAGWLWAAAPVVAADAQTELAFGITPVFLVDQNAFLVEWKRYLEQRLHRPVTFVRRKS